MIKDILFHLSADAAAGSATEYAVSVAEAFGAHLAGVAFAYDPALTIAPLGIGLPADIIEAERAVAGELSLIEVKRRSGFRPIMVPEPVGHHQSERVERLRHITSIPQPEDVAASAAQYSQDPLAEGSVGRRPHGALRPDGRAVRVLRSVDSDTR